MIKTMIYNIASYHFPLFYLSLLDFEVKFVFDFRFILFFWLIFFPLSKKHIGAKMNGASTHTNSMSEKC